MKKIFTILTIITLSFIQLMSQETIPFTSENWTVFDGTFVDFEGKKAFMGTALLNNFEFENGTIEWDMYTTGKRSYPGIFFRMNDRQDFEHFYVRPHKMNGYHYDALQYTPAYHSVSCWQLYHGEGYTKEFVSPANVWVHYKLVVNDDQAKVFIESMENEAFTIHNLEHGISKGSILLNSPADGSAYFANFSVTENIGTEFGKKLVKPVVPGIINKWEVSEPILNNLVDNETLPGKEYLRNLKWQSIDAEPNGMVNLTKNIVREPFEPSWVYVKTNLFADVDKSKWYSFSYSDYVTIFLNGEEIYSGVNAFTSRDPSYAGLLGEFDKIKLNLKKGHNELILIVGEQFGGWGFTFRDAEVEEIFPAVAEKWEIRNQLNYPESVVWDDKNQALYISNYLKGKGEFLSKLSIDGTIIEKEWVKGLIRPTALLLLQDTLLVVERKTIAIIDIKSATIKRRIPIEGASFLNDIVATPDGKKIFISDSEANRIYKLEDEKVQIWSDNKILVKPNALAIQENCLLIGCMGKCNIVQMNIETREIKSLIELFPEIIIDGIKVLDNETILFANISGILYLSDIEGNFHELINVSGKNINFSDFIFIKEKELLIIPGLYSNSIRAYFIDLKKLNF